MKKLLALVLSGVMALSLAACGAKEEAPAAPAASAPAASAPAAETYTVGICQLVQHVALDAATEGSAKQLYDKTTNTSGYGSFAFRHNKTTNALFADGHTENRTENSIGAAWVFDKSERHMFWWYL